jgi:hypothetical protein
VRDAVASFSEAATCETFGLDFLAVGFFEVELLIMDFLLTVILISPDLN